MLTIKNGVTVSFIVYSNNKELSENLLKGTTFFI